MVSHCLYYVVHVSNHIYEFLFGRKTHEIVIRTNKASLGNAYHYCLQYFTPARALQFEWHTWHAKNEMNSAALPQAHIVQNHQTESWTHVFIIRVH
jgi:hypothetical protein